MMSKIRILFFLLFFAPFISNSQDNDSESQVNPFEHVLQNLQNEWRLNAVQDPNLDEVYVHEETDILHLGKDGFRFVIASRNINISGDWEYSLDQGEPLILKQGGSRSGEDRGWKSDFTEFNKRIHYCGDS